MTNKTEAFKRDCRIINMKMEYPGYTDEIKWLIVSDLTEAQIVETYPAEVKPYMPFVYMSEEEYAPVIEYKNNDRKFERRAKTMDIFSYEDDLIEAHHPELITNPFDQEDWSELHDAMKLLPETQRRRIVKRYFYGMSIIQIAAEEGSSRQAVNKSILAALDFLRNIL